MLDSVKDIAQEAGKIILGYYHSDDIHITQKSDNSPVTDADLAAHSFIKEALEKKFNIPVLSEEGTIGFEERSKWDEFWLVDPLDGTKDFIAKNDEFTVNIALIQKHKPVLGVIYVPASEEMFFAEEAKGSFLLKNNDIRQLPRAKCEQPVVVKSRFHETELTKKFVKVNGITKTCPVGSAVKFGRLAEGVANIYPRYVGSKEWDIAAGHIIIKEAGCHIMNLSDRKEPAYNKPSLKNDFFIAYGRGINIDDLDLLDS